MAYTYYIYHIPGEKIGCTTDLVKRMKNQGFTNWEILWQEEGDYEFGWIAGEKEIELQKQYGLPVDTINYQQSRMNRLIGCSLGGSIGGQKNVESGHLESVRDINKFIETGKKNGKLSRTFTMEEAEEIRKEYAIGKISQYNLAKKYNSNHNTIGRIIRKQSYTSA